MHEIGVKDAENRFVSDDEQVILLALQLENNGLQANSKVMIRLLNELAMIIDVPELCIRTSARGYR